MYHTLKFDNQSIDFSKKENQRKMAVLISMFSDKNIKDMEFFENEGEPYYTSDYLFDDELTEKNWQNIIQWEKENH